MTEDTKRKVWFITRPQRDPLFHSEALKVLDEVTEHFTLKWEGNRELQKEYDFYMAEKIVKKMHESGLISDVECTRISAENRRIFSPLLAELT